MFTDQTYKSLSSHPLVMSQGEMLHDNEHLSSYKI